MGALNLLCRATPTTACFSAVVKPLKTWLVLWKFLSPSQGLIHWPSTKIALKTRLASARVQRSHFHLLSVKIFAQKKGEIFE